MPHVRTFLLFDDFIDTNNDWTTPVFTDTSWNQMLGAHDQLALHAIVDCISARSTGTTLYGFIEHSSNGRNWIPRTYQAVVFDGTEADYSNAADLALALGPATTFAQQVWSDACYGQSYYSQVPGSGPFLALVRVRFFFPTTGSSAHVRLYATQRDLRRTGPTAHEGRHA